MTIYVVAVLKMQHVYYSCSIVIGKTENIAKEGGQIRMPSNKTLCWLYPKSMRLALACL